MYRIVCDDKTLHDVRDEEYMLISPKISLELNKTGNLDFGILPSHPEIGNIQKLKSEIAVYDDEELLYAGRPTTDEADFYNYGQVFCEGELAYLLDSIQRPKASMERKYGFSPVSNSIDIFKEIVSEHNSQVEDKKKFAVGIVDVDSEEIRNFDANYEKTWDLINSQFIGKYDGYLRVRHSGGIRYLDYVKQYGKVSDQEIRFGENLLDLKRYIKAEDLVTAIIPVGKNNVTIRTANGQNGKDYIYDPAAVELYGWIYQKVDFPDVNDPDTLLSKAKEYLKTCVNLAITIELTAADLHMVDVDINAIRLGDLVPCVSRQHGLLSTPGDVSTYYLVSKYEVNLDNAANNKITLGRTISTLTAQVAGTANANNLVQVIAKNADTAVGTVNQMAGSMEQIRKEMDEVLNKVYPIGSIYLSVNPTDPSELFGGTWDVWGTGRVPVCVDTSQEEFKTVEKSGGSKDLQKHVHIVKAHSHGLNAHKHAVNITSVLAGKLSAIFHMASKNNNRLVQGYDGFTTGRDTGTTDYMVNSNARTNISQNNKLTHAGHTHIVKGDTEAATGSTADSTAFDTGAAGNGNAQNLQPYITCYMWKRIK